MCELYMLTFFWRCRARRGHATYSTAYVIRHHDAVVAHHRGHKTATIVAPDPPNSTVGTVVVDAPSLFFHCYQELCGFPEDTTAVVVARTL